MGRFFFYNKKTRQMEEGFAPPINKVYGEAPYIITDGMTPMYHHGACMWIDSKKTLKQIDKACGTVTLDKRLKVNESERERKYASERKKDIHQSIRRAVSALDSGNAPLSEETKHLCKVQNKIISDALNFDAFNVIGKKNDRRGKKYSKP